MSKVVMSLPDGMVKNCLIGGGISLLSYILLQMLCALLVDRGVLGLEQMYPLVCVTAALASFLGLSGTDAGCRPAYNGDCAD